MIAIVGYPLSTGPVTYLSHRGIMSMETQLELRATVYAPLAPWWIPTCYETGTPGRATFQSYNRWWADLAYGDSLE